MAVSTYKNVKEQGLPNGAKLLSIIDRLSGRNGLKTTTANETLKLSEESRGVICESAKDISRRRRKGFVSKKRIRTFEGINEAADDIFDSEHAKEPPWNNHENILPMETCEISEPICNGQKVPKVRLVLKPDSSHEAKPSLCLCKSPSELPNVFRQNGKEPKDEIAKSETRKGFHANHKVDTPLADRISNKPSYAGVQDRNSCYKRSRVCGICLQVFCSGFSLEKHIEESGHYLCSSCGEAFNKSVLYEKHVEGKQCKTLKCTMCSTKFVSDEELNMHKEKDHFKCTTCNKLFNTAESLSKHTKSCHSGRRSYYCPQCTRTSFACYAQYKTHMMSFHTGERPFICPECGKGFTRMYALNTHIKYTHSNEKRFKCEQCPKTFKRKDHMKNHQVIHLSKKPFTCDVCGRGFNQKVSLKRHLPCSNRPKSSKMKCSGNQITSKAEKVDENNTVGNSSGAPTSTGEIGKNHRGDLREFLSCDCPPNCKCKKFTIAVSVDTQNSEESQSSFEKLGTLSGCCDVKIREIISQAVNGASKD